MINSGYLKTNHTFLCSDMLKEAVKGATIDYIQLERGILDARLTRVESKKLCIDYGNYNLGLVSQGEMPKDRYTIGMILSCLSPSRYFKVNSTYGDVIYMPPGCELDVLLGSAPKWCTLSFDRQYFEDACKNHMGLGFELSGRHAVVVKRNSSTSELFRTLITILFSADNLLIGHDTEQASEALTEDLLGVCINVIFKDQITCLRKEANLKAELIDRAEEIISSLKFDDIKIQHIAHNLGVNIRTLEYAFRDVYGTTPKKYLTAKKLYNVRREIVNHPTVSITNHAINQGFWHMSQFSLDYKRLFGELPSETKTRALKQN